ncbi:MAG: hypothetical protein CMJ31_11420 [Phycisphaerae bacterium]|nr:hypothetical protein [Phycisphaerae bacterium]
MTRISSNKAAALIALASMASVSAGQIALPRCVIAGGGGVCEGGRLTLTATIGQPVTGAADGGRFDLDAGFWVGAAGSCNRADLARPFGTLDIADVVQFLQFFGAMNPAADLAAPAGTFDIADVVAFLQTFGLGCP